MRNILMVAISVLLLVGAARASFAGDSHLTSKAPAQADTAIKRTSTPAAASQPQNQTTPVKPLHGGAASSTQDLVPHTDPFVVSKEAWQWSDDERIVARLDPVKIRERAAAHAARSFNRPDVSSSLAAVLANR